MRMPVLSLMSLNALYTILSVYRLFVYASNPSPELFI